MERILHCVVSLSVQIKPVVVGDASNVGRVQDKSDVSVDCAGGRRGLAAISTAPIVQLLSCKSSVENVDLSVDGGIVDVACAIGLPDDVEVNLDVDVLDLLEATETALFRMRRHVPRAREGSPGGDELVHVMFVLFKLLLAFLQLLWRWLLVPAGIARLDEGLLGFPIFSIGVEFAVGSELTIRFVGHAASEDTTRSPSVSGIQTTHVVVVVVVVVMLNVRNVRAILVGNGQILVVETRLRQSDVHIPISDNNGSTHQLSQLSQLSRICSYLMLLIAMMVMMMVRVSSDQHAVQSTDADGGQGNNPHRRWSVEVMGWHINFDGRIMSSQPTSGGGCVRPNLDGEISII